MTGEVLPGFTRPNYTRRHFAKVVTKAKLGGLTPHGLRHTWVSLMLSSGFDLGYVSRELGHGSTQLTERPYARWLHDDDTYVLAPLLVDGEVPGDVLARDGEAKESPHQVTPPSAEGLCKLP